MALELYSQPSLNIVNCVTIKLTERNYILWKSQFETFLSGQGFLGFINGATPTPQPRLPVLTIDGRVEDTANPDYQLWIRTDKIVKSWLLGSFSEDTLSVVMEFPTSKDVWSTLANHFNRVSSSRLFELQRKLHTISKNDKTMAAYLQEIKDVCDQLSSIGSLVAEKMKISAALHGLGQEYEPIKTSIEGLMDSAQEPTFADVVPKLTNFDNRLQGYEAGLTVSPHLAFSVTRTSNPSGYNYNNSRCRGNFFGRGNRGRGSFSTRGRGFHQQISPSSGSHSNAYENARKSNISVKGLLITNPSNPLGTTLDRECLKSLVNFTNDKGIHLIADEIYAATTFGQSEFISVAEVIEEIPNCDGDLIHIVYSLSKDMGLPGLRVGIIYSYNDRVVHIARKMSSFGLVSSQTQHLIAKMLSDEDFVDEFIRESKLRLAARHAEITTGLDGLGIGWLKAKAGLFLWMDLRNLLKTATFDSETELWRVIVHKVKLNVSPGGSFHCHEPGWFRVCFANMDQKTMETALERIRVFTSQLEEESLNRNKPMVATTMMAKKKKKCWQSSLRLSFNDTRRFEDGFFSPHSPVPPSPLVRAQT